MPRLDDDGRYISTLRNNTTQQFDSSSRFHSSSGGDYAEGDKVEALYKGKGTKWFSGKVARVNRDGTFDIHYDDGDSDIGALKVNIRRQPDAPSRHDDSGASRRDDRPGDAIQDLRPAFQNAVDDGRADALACFEFYDRDRAGELDEDDFLRGLRKLGVDLGRRETGTIMDTYPGRRRGYVAYVDFLRGLRLSEPRSRRDEPRRVTRLEEGTKVEARYRGKAKYYPGVIKRVNRDGTFDVDYIDGEKETDVAEALVRALDDGRDARAMFRLPEGPPGAEGVSLIAGKVRDQLWEWARGIGKGARTRDALRKVFKAIDKGNTGAVTRAEMATLLSKKMKLSLPPSDLEVLLDCIDVEGSGKIRYEELVDFACSPPEGEEIGVLHERISRDVTRSGADMLRAFERYDEKRRGVVRAEDLGRVLEKCGVDRLRTSDLDELLKRFALGSGSKREVDYDLFVLWVEAGRDLRRVEQRVRTSLQRLVSMGLDFRRIFELADVSRTGFVDEREFHATMRRLGLMLAEAEVRALFHKYNTRGQGLRYADFLDLANESLEDLKSCGLLGQGVVEKLGRWAEDHGVSVLRRAFASGDKGGKGLVSARHFDKTVLKFKTLGLGKADLDLVRRCFEAKGGDGAVAFGGVLELAQHRAEDADTATLHAKLSRAAERDLGVLREALAKQDPDSTGSVKVRSLEKAIEQRLRFDLDRADARLLSSRLDPASRGNVDVRYVLSWLGADSKEGVARAEASAGRALALLKAVGKDSGRIFRALDVDGRSTLTRKAFTSALGALGLPLGDHEVRALTNKYASGETVDYAAFLKQVAAAADSSEGWGAGMEADGGGGGGSDTLLLSSALRAQLWGWYRGQGQGSTEAMLAAFKKEDAARSGRVSGAAFDKVVNAKLKMRVGKADVRLLVKSLDLDSGGGLRYGDFVDFTACEPEGSDEDLGRLQTNLNASLAKQQPAGAKAHGSEAKSDDPPDVAPPPRVVMEAFQQRDSGRSGHVDARTFRRVLEDDLRLTLTARDADDLVARFAIASSEGSRADAVRYDLFARWLCAGHKIAAVERRVAAGLRAIKGLGGDARRPFELLDKDRSGLVAPGDFCVAVAGLGLLVTEGEARALARAYDDAGKGVAWGRLLDLGGKSAGDDSAADKGAVLELVGDDVGALCDELKAALWKWAAKKPEAMAKLFANIGSRNGSDAAADDEADGEDASIESEGDGDIEGPLASSEGLSAKGFRRLLLDCSVRLGTSRDEAAMFKCFDASGGGRRASVELLADFVFAPPLFAEVEAAGALLRKGRGRSAADLRAEFEKADRRQHGNSATGLVARAAFRRAVSKYEAALSQEELSSLERAFGAQRVMEGGGRSDNDSRSGSEDGDRSSRSSDDDEDRRRGRQRSSRGGGKGRARSGSAGLAGRLLSGFRRTKGAEGEGTVDVCWVRFVAWLEAAAPVKVLGRAKRHLSGRRKEAESLADKDLAAKGRLNRAALEAVLATTGFVSSGGQRDSLWALLDPEGAGFIDALTFNALLAPPRGSDKADKEGGDKRGTLTSRVTADGEDWVEEWLGAMRASLEDSFDAIWAYFDGDSSGDLDPVELDKLCVEMLKALNPAVEATKQQVKDLKSRVGAGGRRGVDKDSLRAGLVDFIEGEFRVRLSSGALQPSGLKTISELAGLFGSLDLNGDGVISPTELRFVLCHRMRILTLSEAEALASALDADGDGSTSVHELKRALLAAGSAATGAGGATDALGPRFSPLARQGLRKLAAGFAPRPEEYLSLAALLPAGVSSACKPSLLASFDNVAAGKLGHAISGREAFRQVSFEVAAKADAVAVAAAASMAEGRRGAAPPRSSRLMTMVTLKRADGVPCPDPKHVAGGGARGVRVCMFYAGETDRLTSHDTLVGNQYRTNASTGGEASKDGSQLAWNFPDDPEDGSQEGQVMLSCDPLLVQEDLGLHDLPDVDRKLFVLIELTMAMHRPRSSRGPTHAEPRRGAHSRKSSRKSPSKSPSKRGSPKKGHGSRGEGRGEGGSDAGSDGSEAKEEDSDSDGSSGGKKKDATAKGSSRGRSKKRASSPAESDGSGAESSDGDFTGKAGGSGQGGADTIEVSCGWVKVLLKDLCLKKRDVTLELRHGSPWGSDVGEPLPDEDLGQQNSYRHTLLDTMPMTLGAVMGKKRRCTLTLGCSPVTEQSWEFATVEEVKLYSYRCLPTSQLLDVLDGLPRNMALPVGGSGCASLALFATYCFALRRAAEDHGRGGVVGSQLLTCLPEMVDDPAMRVALLGLWATHFYARLSDLTSRLVSRPTIEGGGPGSKRRATSSEVSRHRSQLLSNLVPLLSELVTDLWLTFKCPEVVTPSSATRQPLQAYLGSFSPVKEARPEGPEAVAARAERIADEYRARVALRARRRRAEGQVPPDGRRAWPDEVVLGAKGNIKVIAAADPERDAPFFLHSPFNTREIKFGVGVTRAGGGGPVDSCGF